MTAAAWADTTTPNHARQAADEGRRIIHTIAPTAPTRVRFLPATDPSVVRVIVTTRDAA